MKSWQKLEIDATDFLNKHYSNYITAVLQGGSNSNISDILIRTTTNKTFNIDVKQKNAQCGQFVLKPDLTKKEFVFSKHNKSFANQSTSKIISFMNKNFDRFLEAGTAGVTIHIPDEETVFRDWIVDYYTHKNVDFLITKKDDFILVPLNEITHYFDIKARYRIKRSGSRGVSEKYIYSIKQLLNTAFDITSIRTEKDKVFVSSVTNLDKITFEHENKTYMFSKRNNEFVIRTLSNTFNANVIFSIDLKNKLSIEKNKINNQFIDFISK